MTYVKNFISACRPIQQFQTFTTCFSTHPVHSMSDGSHMALKPVICHYMFICITQPDSLLTTQRSTFCVACVDAAWGHHCAQEVKMLLTITFCCCSCPHLLWLHQLLFDITFSFPRIPNSDIPTRLSMGRVRLTFFSFRWGGGVHQNHRRVESLLFVDN